MLTIQEMIDTIKSNYPSGNSFSALKESLDYALTLLEREKERGKSLKRVAVDPDTGMLLTRRQFYEMVRSAHLMSDDGTAFYSDGTVYFPEIPLWTDYVETMDDLDSGFTHVLWLNR